MLECIERDGDSIPVRQREQATRCIYACISLEPGEAEAIRQPEALDEAAAKAAREKAAKPTCSYGEMVGGDDRSAHRCIFGAALQSGD